MFMFRLWKRLWCEDEGQALTEFALLLTLVCLTATSSVSCFSLALQTKYSNASNSVTVAASTAGHGSSSKSTR
jgi:Flp pilus assembly pilin Flp